MPNQWPNAFRSSQTPWNQNDPWGQSRTPVIEPYTPEEQESLLSQVLGGAMGGLGAIGNSLDKPGRAVRGLLGGNLREGLAAIPFSDTLGITDFSQATTGRDLLEKSGMLGANEEGLDFGDVAGFGAEMALDPLSFMNFGGQAVNKLGKLAQMAGVKLPSGGAGRLAGLTGKTVAEDEALAMLEKFLARPAQDLEALGSGFGKYAGATASGVGQMPTGVFGPGTQVEKLAGQRLGGHVGLSLPFSGGSDVTLDLTTPLAGLSGAGKAIGNFALGSFPGATQVFDRLKGPVAAGWDNASRALKAMFDPAVKGQFDPLTQQVARRESELEPAIFSRLMLDEAPLNMQAPIIEVVANDKRLRDQFGRGVELGQRTEEMPLGVFGPGREIDARVQELIDLHQKVNPQRLEELRNAGLNVGEVTKQTRGVEHLFRQQSLASEGSGLTKRTLTPAEGKSRLEAFNNLPTYGQRSINELSMRPDLSGPTQVHNAKDIIAREYLGWSDEAEARLGELESLAKSDPTVFNIRADGTPGPTPEFSELSALQVKKKQAEDLANIMREWNPADGEMFGGNPLLNRVTYLQRNASQLAKAQAMHEAFAGLAKPLHEIAGQNASTMAGLGFGEHQLAEALKTHMPLKEAVEKAGMTFSVGGDNQRGALASLIAPLQKRFPNVKGMEDMGNLFVPRREVDTLVRARQALTSPEWAKPMIAWWDSVSNLIKGHIVPYWPGARVRDMMSGFSQNYVHGAYYPSFGGVAGTDYAGPIADALKLGRGEKIAGLENWPIFKGMTNEAANAELNKLRFAFDPSRKRQFVREQVTGQLGVPDERLLNIPGTSRPGIVEDIKQTVKGGTYNPLDIMGVAGKTEDRFIPAAAGRKFQGRVDETLRDSTFIAKLAQGYSPEAAKEIADLAHFNFGNVTEFERATMRRLIPFYGWMRQNIPAMAQQLLENPGGKLGQLTRGLNDLQQDQGFTPEHLQKAAAIPVGDRYLDPQGKDTQRYLASLGLPIEDLYGLIDPRGTMRSGESLLGNLNPLIRGPLEAVTGRQFWSGRDMRDLHSRTGVPWAEQILMNSPVSRWLTSVGSSPFMDERKSWLDWLTRMGSGLKFTDVDMQKAREVAARHLIEDSVAGHPGVSRYQNFYVRREDLPLLSAEDLALMRLQASLGKR